LREKKSAQQCVQQLSWVEQQFQVGSRKVALFRPTPLGWALKSKIEIYGQFDQERKRTHEKLSTFRVAVLSFIHFDCVPTSAKRIPTGK
jgi:hypothetical protein